MTASSGAMAGIEDHLLRAIFEGVGDGILLIDAHGVYLDANSAACALFGVPKHELVGRCSQDFAAPGSDIGAERMKLSLDGQRRGVFWLVRPDGAQRELEYSSVKEISPGLQLSLLRDVTERNRSQEALSASEKKYRQIVDTAREGIWLLDAQSRTTFVNAALAKMLGYTAAEMLGRSVFDFMDSEDAALVAHSLELRRQGIGEHKQQKFRTKHGAELWVRTVASPMSDDFGNYTGALGMMTDITEQRRSEAALRASEERYRLLFESSPLPIWLIDSSTLCFVAVNHSVVELFGYDSRELLGMLASDLISPADSPRLLGMFPSAPGGSPSHGMWQARKRDGTTVELALTAQQFTVDGQLLLLCIGQDKTEQILLEEQLAQSRKMEAIGILAGGVAHDFNNLLSIMLTYAGFVREATVAGDAVRGDIEQVTQAGERAVTLTRQLLAFSRQQILEPKTLDLNRMLAALEPKLSRLLAGNVAVSLHTDAALGTVSVDPGQIEQVILNLVANAQDAMAGGGKLTIETANVSAAAVPIIRRTGSEAGSYVKLAVSDTGSGIDEATLEHIFEPFFTTKGVGKGSGLGLSTALGIVQQSGGYLTVRSVPGKGSTFEVFLPRVNRPVTVAQYPLSSAPPVGGTETILLVEDDEQVRALTQAVLVRNGYQVLTASNAVEALSLSAGNAGPIHLLLTDIRMPRTNGRQLAEQLAIDRPDTRVLFMTGYTNDAVVRQRVLDADVAFLQKPISPLVLARKVRTVLDAPTAGTPI